MPHKTTMNKKYITVMYQYGLLKNLTTEEWLNTLITRFPEYDLFQVLSGTYWEPGSGVVSYLEAILILKDENFIQPKKCRFNHSSKTNILKSKRSL